MSTPEAASAGASAAAPSRPGSLRKGAPASLVARLVGAGLYFLLQLVLSHRLTELGFGVVVTATAWLMILAVPARLGGEYVTMRFTSVYYRQNSALLLNGFWRAEFRRVLVASFLVAGLFLGGAYVWAEAGGSLPMGAALLVAFTIPLMALLRASEGILRGLGLAAFSFVPFWVLLPAIYIVLVLARSQTGSVSVTEALGFQLVATGLSLVLGVVVLRTRVRRHRPDRGEEISLGAAQLWRRTSLQLGGYSLASRLVGQADTVIVAMAVGATAAGPYSVAARMATLLSLALLAANAVVGPRVAHLHAEGDLRRYEPTIRAVAAVVTLASAVGFVLLAVFGEDVLALFGSGMSEAYPALLILGAAQVVRSMVGPSGILLSMTGHQTLLTWILAVGGGISIVGGFLMGSQYGATGVAAATAAAVVGINVASAVGVRRELHILCLPAISRSGLRALSTEATGASTPD